MSPEEVKIRGELEMDVERELEEEIKEGICHLAFRLQRLYQQQQKQKNAKELPDHSGHKKFLSEVNINIKMEGGTKIEIKEIKKQRRENRIIRPPKTESVRGSMTAAAPKSTKKFDWANSLRSGPCFKTDCSNQSRILMNGAKNSTLRQQLKVIKVVNT